VKLQVKVDYGIAGTFHNANKKCELEIERIGIEA
jgi:hypothetical protein